MQVEPFSVNFLSVTKKKSSFSNSLSVTFVETNEDPFSRSLPTVIVDYAHTPDGLKKVLQSIKKLCTGKLITVFGCGGDRDCSKRPLMGSIAEEFSDQLFITSDNPRSEEPQKIVNDILMGIKKEKK